MIVNVSEETGTLSVHGEVNHSSFYGGDNQRTYYNSYDVRRSIFMGDFVYALSAQGVTATNLTTMETSASIALIYENVCYGCYDDVAVSDDGGEGSTSDGSGEAESEPLST